jgi:hypothetical protein
VYTVVLDLVISVEAIVLRPPLPVIVISGTGESAIGSEKVAVIVTTWPEV